MHLGLGRARIYQNLIFFGYENFIDVYDATTATKVRQQNILKKQQILDLHIKVNQIIVENELDYLDVGGPGLLVAACQHGTHTLITIWSIDSPEKITYKCQLDFTGQGGVEIGLNHICVFIFLEKKKSRTIHFISTSTLTIERSVSARGNISTSTALNGILTLTNKKDCIW
jgi:hypothetical protein